MSRPRIKRPTRTIRPDEHNYLRKLMALKQAGLLPASGVCEFDVRHNPTCRVFRSGHCNCDPDIISHVRPETAPESESAKPITVEVFAEDGSLRAFGRVHSVTDAVPWMDQMPCCHTPEERLMVRIEDHNHDGCWLYAAPPDTPEQWIMCPTATRLREKVEGRKQIIACSRPAAPERRPG